jgi:hypothetical protein
LPRYISQIQQDYPGKLILPTYIQTGEQGSYKSIKDAGFVPILRSDLIEIMNSNKIELKNNILMDFFHYLEEIENQVQSYLTLPLDNWEWYAWAGFYNKLQEILTDGEWAYVPNPNGGFMAFYWKSYGDDNCEQYLQLEEDKFCFKIWVGDDDKRQELRQLWHSKVLEKATESSLRIIRPSRFGHGQWMTVAIIDGDYRKILENGTLDLFHTIEVIREAEKILHNTCIV